jgi:hypothetical protein
LYVFATHFLFAQRRSFLSSVVKQLNVYCENRLIGLSVAMDLWTFGIRLFWSNDPVCGRLTLSPSFVMVTLPTLWLARPFQLIAWDANRPKSADLCGDSIKRPKIASRGLIFVGFGCTE